MNPFRFTVLGGLLVTSLIFARLIYNAPINDSGRNTASINEATDIARAIYLYQLRNNSPIDLRSKDWVSKIRETLDNRYKERARSTNVIWDPFDEPYEFSKNQDTISIFSYNMGPVIRVNVETGEISHVKQTIYQSLKQVFFKILL